MNELNKSNIEGVWKDNTEIIRVFLEKRIDYEQLCSEIAYILKKRLEQAEIEISTVSNRAKTLNSFLEKIVRKSYANPFDEITDFAGVRIIFLYQKDLDKIEAIIKKEFEVLERVDKLNDKGIDKFGYGAIHFIVKLGKDSLGARYEDLKNLSCEIQVRTVLQDAWAIIDHHLVYKRESEIPTSLQRKLNGLAGLFETADNQFDIIRQERESYLLELDNSKTSNEFLNNEINLDTFKVYLKWKFPSYDISYFDRQPEIILKGIQALGLSTLNSLDEIVKKYENDIPLIKSKFEDEFGKMYFEGHEMPSSLLVSTILDIESPEYMEVTNTPSSIKDFINNAFKSIKK